VGCGFGLDFEVEVGFDIDHDLDCYFVPGIQPRVGQWAGSPATSPAQPIRVGQTNFSATLLPTQPSPFVIF